MDRNMEEKKGLLSALAEALKQYELNQSDDKESQVIALEEKLDEIAKMISSLSDRVDSLSSRLTSIGDKVDSLAAVEPKVEEDDFEAVTAEPVFDAADVDDSFHLTMDEDVFEEPAVEEEDIDEQIEAEEAQEPVEENADAVENAPEAESEPEPEEEVTEQEVETEDNPVAEEEAVEEEKAEEEPVEEPEGVSTKTSRDWYDWEYDYPAEYVDSLLDSMGINDKLEFVRELFNSDPAKFDSQMREVETMPNFKAIVQFFRQAHPEWDQGSDTVYRFYMHIRRKFRN